MIAFCWLQLTRTLSKASVKVGGFFMVLIVVIVGSAQAFMLAFGTKLADYRNMTESVYSLVRALLMDFNLQVRGYMGYAGLLASMCKVSVPRLCCMTAWHVE